MELKVYSLRCPDPYDINLTFEISFKTLIVLKIFLSSGIGISISIGIGWAKKYRLVSVSVHRKTQVSVDRYILSKQYSYAWNFQLKCSSTDEAIFGTCGSGRTDNCGDELWFGIQCCQIESRTPAAAIAAIAANAANAARAKWNWPPLREKCPLCRSSCSRAVVLFTLVNTGTLIKYVLAKRAVSSLSAEQKISRCLWLHFLCINQKEG